jgi:predicted GIY-YIG superfamily endonuclease
MVYMLTFPPIGGRRHQARFYVGFCDDDRDPAERLAEHRAGRGAATERVMQMQARVCREVQGE